jgi:glycosyltransferase involved in cell wall biosynthesis
MSRRGIESAVMGDVMDFNKPVWQVDDYNKDFISDIGAKENDLIILQATRIVRRKGIGLAIDVVEELTKRKEELVGKKLYNGKTITEDSNIVLVLSGFTELVDQPYKAKLEEKISKTNIKALFINDIVGAKRKPNDHKKYSLWDCYAHADIITYPSLFEGWGNQFIEAVFAKKPIILFEYPVFKADIKKEGYFYLSLGDKADNIDTNGLVEVDEAVIQKVSREAIQTLIGGKQTLSKLENNFEIGKQKHSTLILTKFLVKKINELVND